MKCILTKCAWDKEGCCKSLGDCGAAHALERAGEPGGYRVLPNGNKTISALVKAGFVTTQEDRDTHSLIVTAKPKVTSFAALQGRIESAA